MTEPAKTGIIDQKGQPEGKPDVHTVGRIDIEKYKCVTEDIQTDEVIITDERIAHIKDRRGQDFFDKYSQYFSEVISDPDYIFRDVRMNSALACKSIATENAVINLVIRLAVENDDPMFKNSIITAIKESSKRFAQRLRNHEPLYKRE